MVQPLNLLVDSERRAPGVVVVQLEVGVGGTSQGKGGAETDFLNWALLDILGWLEVTSLFSCYYLA